MRGWTFLYITKNAAFVCYYSSFPYITFSSHIINIVDIIKNSKQIKVKSEKDYIKSPKDTGYISYHLIVYVPIYINNTVEYIEAEIQIRTLAMDFWASLDNKIQYKFPNDTIPEEVKQEMYNCAFDIQALDSKMEKLNDNQIEIYVIFKSTTLKIKFNITDNSLYLKLFL